MTNLLILHYSLFQWTSRTILCHRPFWVFLEQEKILLCWVWSSETWCFIKKQPHLEYQRRIFDSPLSVQKILNIFSWSNDPLCKLNPTEGGEREALLKLNKVFEVAAAQNFWASHSDFLSSNGFLFFLKRVSARRAVSIKIQGNQRIITVGLDTLRAKRSLIRVAPMYWSDIGAKPVLCAHRVSVRKVSFRPV